MGSLIHILNFILKLGNYAIYLFPLIGVIWTAFKIYKKFEK
ncbi:MAG: hypothetical protein OEZ34_14340 [Spirochaetia bacterium]|nr:hypothetical protein [Spirochaetia bacterium]